MNRWLCIFFLVLFVSGIQAQVVNDNDNGKNVLVDLEGDGAPPAKGYRSQFNIGVSAPHYFLNPANVQAFTGIINIDLWYSIKVHKNFSMGPYARYTGFEYYAGRVNQSNPLVTHISSGLQMSYEVKMGDRFSYIPSLFLGFGYVQYNNLSLPTKGVGDIRNKWYDWGFAAQTNQSFYYYCTQNRKIAVGLVIGLSFNTHQFKLKETGLTSDASINTFSDKGPTLFGNIGFALLMNFGKIR